MFRVPPQGSVEKGKVYEEGDYVVLGGLTYVPGILNKACTVYSSLKPYKAGDHRGSI